MKNTWKLVLPIVALLLLSLSAPTVALAQTTATRDIAEQALAPGDTTQVTVTINVAEAEALALDENPPDGWTLTRSSETAAADACRASTNEWLWFQAAVGTITVIYDLTVPADAAVGSYTIAGTITGEGWSVAVGGETEIEVTTVPPPPEGAELEFSGSLARTAFATSNLCISPGEVYIGETVTISVLITNTGDGAGSYTVTLKINGVAEATKDISLVRGVSQEVTFTTTKDVAGSYSVEVNGLQDSFTVKEKPAPPPPTSAIVPPVTPPAPVIKWPLVGGIVAGVVAVGLLIFFLARKRAA
jgi:hypothetical protein